MRIITRDGILYIIFSFSRQAFPEPLTSKNTRNHDCQTYEDGAHGVEEDCLLAEVLVFHSQVSDHNPAQCVKSSSTTKN